MARPLINLYHPELAGFVDPLSANFAARRTLLTSLPFPAGYGVTLSLLLDAARAAGIDALAHAILAAVAARVHRDEDLDELAPGPLFLPLGRSFESRRVAVEERPPLDSI